MARERDSDTSIKEYRTLLMTLEQKAQEDFDKTVLTLSGGALGVSFAFVKDFVGQSPIQCPWLLFGAWLAWGVSVTLVLVSFFSSNLALRKAIKQLDDDKIHSEHPGGVSDKITAFLNISSGILFLLGVVFSVFFVFYNLENNHGN